LFQGCKAREAKIHEGFLSGLENYLNESGWWAYVVDYIHFFRRIGVWFPNLIDFAESVRDVRVFDQPVFLQYYAMFPDGACSNSGGCFGAERVGNFADLVLLV